MGAQQQNLIRQARGIINRQLDNADSWSAIKEWADTFATNNTPITQPDLDAVFGTTPVEPPTDPPSPPKPNMLLADWNAAYSAQQSVVNFIHTPATAAKLYRVKE